MCTCRHCLICKSLAHAGTQLSQRELIARAFAGDDVQAEFEEAKSREAEEEAPKVDAPSLLPGWGAWAGQQRTPGWMAKAQDKAQRCCHFPYGPASLQVPMEPLARPAIIASLMNINIEIGSSTPSPEDCDGEVPHCRQQSRFMHTSVALSSTSSQDFDVLIVMHRQRQEAIAKRKDAKLAHVVISERYDKKAARYGTPSVPFPFGAKDVYERSMRQPLGREFNTDSSFRWISACTSLVLFLKAHKVT